MKKGMVQVIVTFVGCMHVFQGYSQELFVRADNASIIPAGSLNVTLAAHLVANDRIYARSAQRYIPELMVGVNKHLEIRVGGSMSDMHTYQFRTESVSVYGKYRLLTRDGLHRHFRVATFLSASLTRAPFHYDEASLSGDKSGMGLGCIAAQLINRFAFAATISHLQLFDKSRFNDVVYLPTRNFQLINYSVSSGYLLLPKMYRSFKQPNMNIYVELIGQRSLDLPRQYLDLAPALQCVLFSSLKLNASYRFQLEGTMDRMTHNSWMIAVEKSFLNAFPANRRTRHLSS